MGSVVLPHLTTGWHVDQAILTEEERLVIIRFGRDWDPDCMRQDEVLYRVADRVKNFAVIYVCDLDQVPDFKQMYELYDRMTLMFFFRNKHMMCDFGTGNNNKLNWVLEDKQELIDIMETIYRGAKKGRGLVVSPKDYSTRCYATIVKLARFDLFRAYRSRMAAQGLLESWSPWPSRANTPKPGQPKADDTRPATPNAQQSVDHTLNTRFRFKLRDYPSDCPPSQVKWYYAVDVPKRKPLPHEQLPQKAPAMAPKKYIAFSARDSRAIESTFRKAIEEEDGIARDGIQGEERETKGLERAKTIAVSGQRNTSPGDDVDKSGNSLSRVPVNEDFLFDVDIEKRELAPTYWLGPVYDVRRGVWFYQEGSNLRPCDENLANQLEEGYLKIKPWRYAANSQATKDLQAGPKQQTKEQAANVVSLDGASASKPEVEASAEDRKDQTSGKESSTAIAPNFQLQTQRLFGAYMNSVVTYQDANVAWILTDDLLSRMSSTVYQRFAGGGHLGGTKVVRGFTETSKAKDKKSEANQAADDSKLGTDPTPRSQKRRSAPPDIKASENVDPQRTDNRQSEAVTNSDVQPESKIASLQRQMSTIVASPTEDPAKQDEQARRGDEEEIQEDYKEADGDDPGRQIEHLILVTHGIGQRLGLRMENLNFIRDVNKLRKTLKSVYDASPDLQALNNELEQLPKNCRIQVLPVVWRHLLDFPKQSFKQNGKEQDLTDVDNYGEEEKYPSLNDITVEGVPGIRNLITDLALDILLYQSAYREHIAGIVQRECNRIYELFLQRNPSFNGKVSLIGHSLGSAILFDILCRQKGPGNTSGLPRDRRNSKKVGSISSEERPRELGLNFEVESFFCLGSPLGLYQMLKGRKIAARDSLPGLPCESSLDLGPIDDPSTAADSELLTITVSSPKCQQLFNIFHPADAIAYRIEPLISPAMSALKPQPLPYTKKGMFAPGQGFTGIGARVGQSVSGLWSNITSGVASSLLNRSLGISGEGQAPTSAPTAPTIAPSPRAGTNATGTDQNSEEHPPTLIDSEIETLYAGFQKRRKSQQSDDARDLGERPEWQDADARAKKLQREEVKVRALNSNGRVDYNIQE
ncbi:MAG: hypothetical protein Q9218_002718 [Villophora microphyllina]